MRLLSVLFLASAVPAEKLRLMTFNIWNSGRNVENGLDKIAQHIKLQNPHVVAIQLEAGILPKLLQLLGSAWTGVQRKAGSGLEPSGPVPDYYPDTGVLSRLPILNGTYHDLGSYGIGMCLGLKLALKSGPMVLHLWSLHLDASNYGPYAACSRLVNSAEQLRKGEYWPKSITGGRLDQIIRLAADPVFQAQISKSDSEPLFVLGDFNSPSHLDWTEKTRKKHCNWTFPWPAPKMLGAQGLLDAFRAVHPDPAAVPGNTWSPGVHAHFTSLGTFQYSIPEPLDRIDHITYMGKRVKPVDVNVYHGTEPIKPMPDQAQNDWPSDHASVVGDFDVN